MNRGTPVTLSVLKSTDKGSTWTTHGTIDPGNASFVGVSGLRFNKKDDLFFSGSYSVGAGQRQPLLGKFNCR